MKKLIVWVLAFMLVFTEVLFPIPVHAEETKNQCDDMIFSVEAPLAGDEKLVGEGQDSQIIELNFNNLEAVIEVNVDGSFEYEWKEEMPEVDDIITLKNGPYEIELIVTEETVKMQPIEAERIGVCEEDTIIQDEEPPEEKMQDEEQIEETGEEASEMEEEVTEEAPVGEEPDNEEEIEIDEEKQEASTEELKEEIVDTAEETSSEEATKEEVETPIEANKDEDSEAIEPESEETPDEEIVDGPESDGELQSEETEEEVLKESTPPAEDSNEVVLIEEELEEIESEEENPEEKEDHRKLKDEDSEGVEEDSDVINKKMQKNEMTEAVEEDGEIVKGSFFSLFNTDAATFEHSEVPIAPITRETVRVSTPNQFNDALSSRNVERIILEADIRQPNPSVVQSNTGRKIIDANGNNIDLVNSTMVLSNGGWFNTNITELIIRNGNLFTTNNADDGGFIKKENLSFTLHLENINFNVGNDGANGKLGASWESTVKFYGVNIINTKSPYNGLSFQRVIVSQDAILEFNHNGNSPVLSFDRNWNLALGDVYGLEINENARVNISSDGPVFETDLTRLLISGREVQNTIKRGAQVVFEGEADTLFILDTSTNFVIEDPMSVKFNNKASNGLLFSRTVSFNVKETLRKDWARGNVSEKPSYTSGVIQQEQFNIGSNIRRLEFTQPIYTLEPFDVDAVFDTHTSITGRTLPGVVIEILDVDGRRLAETTSDKGGKFKFEAADLNDGLKAGTKYKFKAKLGSASAETDLIVQGNRLEFSQSPPDIIFETKEIKDEVQIIDRQSPEVYTFAVKDTRENGNWKITANADPLNDGDGNNLENSLYFFDEDGEKSLIEKSAVQVASKDMMDSSDTQEVSWGANEGILLEINTIFAEVDKEYAATVNWTLSNGP